MNENYLTFKYQVKILKKDDERKTGKKETYFVKIEDDFVQNSQAFHSLVVSIEFHVEFRKVGYRCKEYTDFVVLLTVQLLGSNKNKIVFVIKRQKTNGRQRRWTKTKMKNSHKKGNTFRHFWINRSSSQTLACFSYSIHLRKIWKFA